MTKQYTNLGDINFSTYGGSFITEEFVNSPKYGVVRELTLTNYNSDTGEEFSTDINQLVKLAYIEDNTTKFVYVEKDFIERNTNLPHPIQAYQPWFIDGLNNVADYVGITLDDLLDELCSSNILDLGRVYESIALYHGWENFDGYPVLVDNPEIRYKHIDDLKYED